jgi:hypothetical protein
MANKPNRYKRKLGNRRYRVLFLLSVEGAVTEQQYLNMFNSDDSIIKIECIKKSNRSSPKEVLKAIKKFLAKIDLKKDDEAWLIVDKDQWPDDQLRELFQWTKEKQNYYFALSNPCFEYWLLLHFENPRGKINKKSCSARLKRYLPDYDKNILANKFTDENINAAISRAEAQLSSQQVDWPTTTGTTVYRLIKNINQARAKHQAESS